MYLFFGSGGDFDSSQSPLNLLNKKNGSDSFTDSFSDCFFFFFGDYRVRL